MNQSANKVDSLAMRLVKSAFAFGAPLTLVGCGVPSNPEKGPVILSCNGVQTLRAGNGESERQKLTRIYEVDGVSGSLDTWDGKKQQWMGNPARIVVAANEITHEQHTSGIGGTATTRLTFDRVSGQVLDDFTSATGSIKFEGDCKPVKTPTSERKF